MCTGCQILKKFEHQENHGKHELRNYKQDITFFKKWSIYKIKLTIFLS